MYKTLSCSYLILLLISFCGNSEAYEYPLTNPYEAAIIGTPVEFKAEIPEKVNVSTRKLKVFQERKTPDIFWYDDYFRYSLATQKGSAPLIFVIAGTGADYYSPKMDMLLRVFYQAGFHVVTLTSPTHPNFIVSASSNSVPGNISEDSKDLYRVMELVWAEIR